MGRAFDAIPNRVAAYTIDVFGSLTGIAAFAAMSCFELSPHAWFVPVVALLLHFAGWREPVQLAAALGTLSLVGIGSHGLLANGELVLVALLQGRLPPATPAASPPTTSATSTC